MALETVVKQLTDSTKSLLSAINTGVNAAGANLQDKITQAEGYAQQALTQKVAAQEAAATATSAASTATTKAGEAAVSAQEVLAAQTDITTNWQDKLDAADAAATTATTQAGIATGAAEDVAGLVGAIVRRVDTVSALRDLADPETVLTAQTLGCAAVADGGGGVWYWDANSAATNNTGTVILPTGHVGNGRWVRVYDGSTVNVRWFGAFGNGNVDESSAIQLAVNCGAKRVKAPAGRYLIHATITIPQHVSLEGDGLTATIFDGSGATYSNLTGGCHFKTQGGSLVDIGSLASDVSKGDRTLTFTLPPELSIGDVIVIYNPTDYSFSGFKNVYRAGEMARVAKVNGSTVTLQGTLTDSYDAADVDVYRLDGHSSCRMRGFTLKGLAGATGAVTGLYLTHVVNSSIEDVRVWNCSYGQILLKQSLGVQLRNVICEEDFATDYGTDYGLVIANSQSINVIGGYYCAARHGITTGGVDSVGDVPCRHVYIQDATISTSGDSSAADFHGNTEYAWYDNCVIDGGVTLRGDFVGVTNCRLRGTNGPTYEYPVYVAETRGFNVNISGNTIEHIGTYPTFGSGMVIRIVFSENTRKGGVVNVDGNVLLWDLTDSSVNHKWLTAFSTSYAGNEAIECRVTNNTLRVKGTGRGVYAEVSAEEAGRPWDCVTFTGNSIDGAGLLYLRNTGAAGSYSALRAIIENNACAGSFFYSVYAEDVRDYISFKNNHITGGIDRVVYLAGSNGYPCRHIEATGNTLLDNRILRSGNTTVDTSGLSVWYATYASVHDNISGTFHELLVVGSNVGFVKGETVTGGTSGATAVVKDFRITTELMIERTRSGTFSGGETITGSISGVSTTYTSTAYTVAMRNSYNTITALYEANNNDLRLTTDYRNAITGYLSGSVLTGSSTYNPPSLADGESVATTVTVTGASFGDYVTATFSNALQGIEITASVTATGTVTVTFRNNTGGPIDLSSGFVRVRVTKI